MSQYHPTAISRHGLSRPMRTLIQHELLNRETKLLDVGAGRGGCISWLRSIGIYAWGYDPMSPENLDHRLVNTLADVEILTRIYPWNIVTCFYVINVIEDIKERRAILRKCWELTTDKLAIAVRIEKIKGTPFLDGVKTKRGTFQKRYSHKELEEFVTSTLDVPVTKLAPGIVLLRKGEER